MTPTAAPLFLAADVGGTRARFLLARWRESEAAPEDREKPPQRASTADTPSTAGFSRHLPAWEPLCQRAVLASASARAASSRWATKALSSGCTASLRARQASTTASGVSWPLR